ncbi:insulin-like receptor [Sitodiplosis mosellana]|uniref:insulin-like receptor n=1 Tax=Sitodiplosis mosellana TaxID=263140 RepID=UPI0024438051|nr:insulin-like receptor [Sitodiplosis mosellana]XP_055296267.1 insulin-like receptor [Sitodiplosis mosellana]XP_055296268.1 insulin-like receptor [Sitodiplosis mosellana]XP_055296269.1 insulin-like receptor [Sitodiplosis mosellana]XP_055296270.1 insulin-like receptor [Sitodiplosis mosellana]
MPFSRGNLRIVRQTGVASFLCFVVMLLITATAPPVVYGRICSDVDVRNDPSELELKLRNCTAIIGSISIVLIETFNHTDFNDYKFPELKEITGYLLLFRVFGLKSLRNLFPNLTVIRGERLISHYALIIYEMTDLTEIGLTSLIKIQRGYVMIRYCPMLCYVHTINWEAITQARVGSGLSNYLDFERWHQACPLSCPDSCPSKNCWNNWNCQLFETGRSNTIKNLKCHEECIGGCSKPSASGCQVCRHFRNMIDKKCVVQCPPNLYAYSSFCVETEYCLKANKKPLLGECRDSCPLIIIEKNVNVKNVEQCARECPGTEVDSMATSDLLRGCQIVKGDIFIRLQSGVANTMQLLERNLGDIEEIEGILKIYRSPVITSLSFLRSLRIIRGISSENSKYTFIVTSNENLVELWNWNEKSALQLIRGNLLVHFNSKLCLNQIQELQKVLKTNTTADFISPESNGYEQTCTATVIVTSNNVLSSSSVKINWDKITVLDTEKIVGYIIYYIVAPTRTVSRLSIDTCVQYGWQTHFIQNFTDDAERTTHSTIIDNLTQNTQYAYYVKTQVVPKEHEDDVIGVSQGLSNIKYFRTFADVPTYPYVETLSKTNTSITLAWSPTNDNELIEWYKVDVFIQPDDHELLDQRDYCTNPRIDTHVSVGVEVSSPNLYQNCSTEFENWKIANPESVDPEYEWRMHRKAECSERNSRHTKEENQSQILKYVKNHKILNCADEKKCNEKSRFSRQIHGIFANDDFETNRDNTDHDLGKYHIGTHIYPAQHRNTTYTDLLPYTMYIYQFFSCNEMNCSTYFLYYDRTDSSISADDVPSFSINVDSQNQNQVHLEFSEPKTPNGLTVAFHIEKHDLSNSKVTTFCMPWKQYVANGKNNNGHSYTVHHLDKGQYLFRVRSVSLALNGAYTEYQMVTIYDKSLSTMAIIGIVFLCVLVAFLIGTIVIYFYRHMRHRLRVRSQNASTQNILLEMDETETAHDEDIPSFYHANTADRDLF